MPKLPRLTGTQMVRFLIAQGFIVKRIRGSHHFLEKNNHRTCVPVHGNKELRIGTLRSILRDIQMAPDEFTRKHRR